MKNLGILIFALCGMISAAQSQGGGNPFVVTIVDVPNHGVVNVRKQARSASRVVGKLNEGVQTFASGVCWNTRTKKLFSWHDGMPANNTGIWCDVQMPNGKSGWVLSKYLQQG